MAKSIWDKQTTYVHRGPNGTGTFPPFLQLRWLRAVNGGRCEELCFLAAMIEVDLEGKGYRWVADELVRGYHRICLAWTMTGDKRMCLEWDTILAHGDWKEWIVKYARATKSLRQPYASFHRRFKSDPIDAWKYLLGRAQKRMLIKRDFYEKYALGTSDNITGIEIDTFEKFLKRFDQEAHLINNVVDHLEKAGRRNVDRQERIRTWHTKHDDELEERRLAKQAEKQARREENIRKNREKNEQEKQERLARKSALGKETYRGYVDDEEDE